jgi:hypothetical protein
MPSDDRFCNEQVAAKVAYEIAMFRFLCGELDLSFQESVDFTPGHVSFVGTGGSEDDERRTSALLESLLLHTRVLLDFFDKTDRCKDDVLASDFVPNWADLRPAPGPYFADEDRKERLNKALAHLTLKRLDYDHHDKKWNIPAIRREIGIAIDAFIDNLPPDRRPWFDQNASK